MEENKVYNDYVKNITPKSSCIKNMFFAFIVGGIICAIGEAINELMLYIGYEKDNAGLITTIILVLSSVLLTGLNIYSKIAKYAGAGTLVPITGFANSVVAPAIEYKTEGQVFGIGCKIFTIAGPVILYGILSSWILGVIYFVCSLII